MQSNSSIPIVYAITRAYIIMIPMREEEKPMWQADSSAHAGSNFCILTLGILFHFILFYAHLSVAQSWELFSW